MKAVPTNAARPVASSGQVGSEPVTPTPPLPFNRPSDRSDIPVTSGLPTGPGPGPEVLGSPQMSPLDKLKRMYRLTQNPDLLQLILLAEEG